MAVDLVTALVFQKLCQLGLRPHDLIEDHHTEAQVRSRLIVTGMLKQYLHDLLDTSGLKEHASVLEIIDQWFHDHQVDQVVPRLA